MNDKSLILERILSDARAKADEAIAKAEETATENLNNVQAEVETMLAEEVGKAREEGKKLVERRATVARLDGKRIELAAKQQLIKQVFECALQKLNKLDKAQYLALVAKQIEKYATEGDTVILAANAPLKAEELFNLPAVKQKNIRVKNGGNFNGGILIEGKKADIDLSFTALIALYEEENYSKIATALFGEDE